MQQRAQSVDPRLRTHQILSEITQNRFESDQVFDVVIDQQNIDLFFGLACILCPTARSTRNDEMLCRGKILSATALSIAASGIIRPCAVNGS
jgi:hypothetical protein